MPDKVWTVPANGGESIVESYGYRTDVMPAYTNAEQRVQLRAVPLETLEFGIMAVEAREAQLAVTTIFGTQDEVVILPLWQYGSRLVVDTLIGQSLFFTADDVTNVPYRINGHALLWRDPFTYELFRVTSLDPGGVSVLDPATKNWLIGSMIFPARRARLPDRVALKQDSTRVLTGRVQFTVEQDLP